PPSRSRRLQHECDARRPAPGSNLWWFKHHLGRRERLWRPVTWWWRFLRWFRWRLWWRPWRWRRFRWWKRRKFLSPEDHISWQQIATTRQQTGTHERKRTRLNNPTWDE